MTKGGALFEFTANIEGRLRVACLLPGQREAAFPRGQGPLRGQKIDPCSGLVYALVLRSQLQDCHLPGFAPSHCAAQHRCIHLYVVLFGQGVFSRPCVYGGSPH